MPGGLTVLQGKEGWAPARRIWNQHAYSVTNINEDGSLPTMSARNPSFAIGAHNGFHLNVPR